METFNICSKSSFRGKKPPQTPNLPNRCTNKFATAAVLSGWASWKAVEPFSRNTKPPPTTQTACDMFGDRIQRKTWKTKSSHTYLLGPGDLRPLGRCCLGRAAHRVSRRKIEHFTLCSACWFTPPRLGTTLMAKKYCYKTDTAKYRCHFIPAYPPPLPRLRASAAAATGTPGSGSTARSQHACEEILLVPSPWHNTGKPALTSQSSSSWGFPKKPGLLPNSRIPATGWETLHVNSRFRPEDGLYVLGSLSKAANGANYWSSLNTAFGHRKLIKTSRCTVLIQETTESLFSVV